MLLSGIQLLPLHCGDCLTAREVSCNSLYRHHSEEDARAPPLQRAFLPAGIRFSGICQWIARHVGHRRETAEEPSSPHPPLHLHRWRGNHERAVLGSASSEKPCRLMGSEEQPRALEQNTAQSTVQTLFS